MFIISSCLGRLSRGETYPVEYLVLDPLGQEGADDQIRIPALTRFQDGLITRRQLDRDVVEAEVLEVDQYTLGERVDGSHDQEDLP